MTDTVSPLSPTVDGGARIQHARYNLGLTASALALRVDVSQQAVARWERGEVLPHPEKAVALAEVLGWPDFLTGYLGTASSPAREG